jgi:hypothetical protein
MPDRYLVTQEDSLNRIRNYLSAIMPGDPDEFSMYERAFDVIFPKLAVVFTKAREEDEFYNDEDDTVVKARVFKPVNMHVLLTAGITSSTRETTFLGARVSPIVPVVQDPEDDDGDWSEERLIEVNVQLHTHIRHTDKAFVFPADTDLYHVRGRGSDYRLRLHIAHEFMSHPEVLPRQLKPVKETVEALFSIIPVRKQGAERELAQVEISCNEHEFKLLCDTVSEALILSGANSPHSLRRSFLV